MNPLKASHAELRGALIFAGRHILKLSRSKSKDPAIAILRDVIRRARLAAKAADQPPCK